MTRLVVNALLRLIHALVKRTTEFVVLGYPDGIPVTMPQLLYLGWSRVERRILHDQILRKRGRNIRRRFVLRSTWTRKRSHSGLHEHASTTPLEDLLLSKQRGRDVNGEEARQDDLAPAFSTHR